MGGEFYIKVHEVSRDLIQLLEDLIDEGSIEKNDCDPFIEDHQEILPA